MKNTGRDMMLYNDYIHLVIDKYGDDSKRMYDRVIEDEISFIEES